MTRSVATEEAPSGCERTVAYVIAATVVVTPLVYSASTNDPFRFPKGISVRDVIIVVVALAGLASIQREPLRWMFGRDHAPFTAGAILVRTLVSPLTSTNFPISQHSAARVVGLTALMDHPITGVGPGCFSFNYFDHAPIRTAVRDHQASLQAKR